MADHEHTRKAFEDAVFNRRFRASIGRNPNPPKGFGGLDFISTDCPTQAELCKRDAEGDYEDEAVSAMWWGWRAALTHGVRVGGEGQPVAWLRAGATPWPGGWETCEPGDPNGFPVYRALGVALGDGAEQRVEAFAARRLAEIRGCKLGCGAVGQCKANAHGIPSDCPARGVKASDGGDRG
jgi:hypothetical protein